MISYVRKQVQRTSSSLFRAARVKHGSPRIFIPALIAAYLCVVDADICETPAPVKTRGKRKPHNYWKRQRIPVTGT